MTMGPRLRKVALTAHVAASVGWLGAVAGFLALAIAGLTSHDPGVLRYYWILAKLVLTVIATIVLLLKMAPISYLAGAVGENALSSGDLRGVRIELVAHAAGGLFVLVIATTLSVFKPWGLTRYGRQG